MDALSYKTQFLKKGTIKRDWTLVDAANIPLGRLASCVALRLRGKHRTDFTPHLNCGDKVVVINAAKVKLTGNKWDQKVFLYHTGYPGGQKAPTYRMIRQKNPAKVIEIAVKGMLPKNRLGRDLFRNLYVYGDDQHPHAQQNPQPLTLHIR